MLVYKKKGGGEGEKMAGGASVTFSVTQCLRTSILFLMISLSRCLNQTTTPSTSCVEMRNAYTEKGFDQSEVPATLISGEYRSFYDCSA